MTVIDAKLVDIVFWDGSPYRVYFEITTRESFRAFCDICIPDRDIQIECYMSEREIAAGQQYLLSH